MKKNLIFIALCLIIATSCSDSDNTRPLYPPEPEIPQPKPEKPKSKRVVLAYMFGDVNLWEFIHTSVNQMEEAAPNKEDGTLLIYLDHSPSVTQFRSPVLLEVKRDSTKSIKSRIVKEYPKDQDAAKPEVFASILKQMTEEFPAESYGLIMAGHGNGWLIREPKPTPQTKGIGTSERLDGENLDIDEIADAIPASLHFDFIAFHACLMAEAATLYQLREKCDYVVASVETLPSYAFPYHLATKYLFTQPHADLYNFIATTTQYYEEEADKAKFYYYTLGLYQMDQMEQLAKATKKCMDEYTGSYRQMSQDIWNMINNDKYKKLMKYPCPEMDGISEEEQSSYDFKLLTWNMQQTNQQSAKELLNALEKVVRIKNTVLGSEIELEPFDNFKTSHSGLSFYIPNKKLYAESEKAFYERFGWAKAAGFTPEKDFDFNPIPNPNLN